MSGARSARRARLEAFGAGLPATAGREMERFELGSMKKRSANEKTRKWRARRSRVRARIGTTDRPRLTVYRSAKHIYAQL